MKTILYSVVLSAFVLFSSSANSQGLPVFLSFNELSKDTQRQVTCLAENIYFEARSENLIGKAAVAFVTLNRVVSGNFPNTICGVVYQKIRGVCQFSWYCDSNITKKKLTIYRSSLYNDIRSLAMEIILYYHLLDDITKGATYFHNTKVNPGWKLQKTNQIGNHVFYRSKRDKVEKRKHLLRV
jgi:spore germination cell wall hydrolase CwlJ-like protein